MKQATRFAVQKSWRLLMLDLGLDPASVLALAQLPADLFARAEASLTPAEYFRLWQGMDAAAGGADLALRLGQAISIEAFDPVIFACLCSPDLNTALARVAQYKQLIGPLLARVDAGPRTTAVSLACYGQQGPLPRSLAAAELVFFTQLARLATRHRVVPVAVSAPTLPSALAPYEAFFGCPLKTGREIRIVFSRADACRPFLTENAAMWQTFEASLNARLSALTAPATVAERVRGALLQLLPAGLVTIDDVAARLAMSRRSLQRHLREEAVSFQDLLAQVRAELAKHYLASSAISPGEIAWLLGFRESNSFHRAFRHWTGVTPGAWRHAQQSTRTH